VRIFVNAFSEFYFHVSAISIKPDLMEYL